MAEKDIIEYDDKTISVINKLINKSFKKKYNWFISMTITRLTYNQNFRPKGYVGIQGIIYVDSKWGKKQWDEYSSWKPIPEQGELAFGEIIGGDLSKEISEELLTIFTSVTGSQGDILSWSWVDTYFVDRKNKKLQEQTYRIKQMMGITQSDGMNKSLIN